MIVRHSSLFHSYVFICSHCPRHSHTNVMWYCCGFAHIIQDNTILTILCCVLKTYLLITLVFLQVLENRGRALSLSRWSEYINILYSINMLISQRSWNIKFSLWCTRIWNQTWCLYVRLSCIALQSIVSVIGECSLIWFRAYWTPVLLLHLCITLPYLSIESITPFVNINILDMYTDYIVWYPRMHVQHPFNWLVANNTNMYLS